MTMITIDRLIADLKITLTAKRADSNPHMDAEFKGGSHWKCVLRCARRRMTVYFSLGAAHVGEPKVGDVLDCLASDAAGFNNSESFEDWAREYGYNIDSRRAERSYRAVEKQARDLRRLLGSDAAYNTLLFGTERC